MGTFDFIYQKYILKREEINYTRVEANALIGTFCTGPFLFAWFSKVHPFLMK